MKHSPDFFSRPVVPLLALLVAAAALAAAGWVFFSPASSASSYPELSYLAAHQDMNFAEFSKYFQDLAEKKGGVYAFEVLKYAAIPAGIDVHLVGHGIGTILYKQKGIDAIRDCTQDFRNACSHSVVIGILEDYGEGALSTIADVCRKAPGGSGAYTMCFHGLGHGVLAYNEYNLPQAVAMCKKTGTGAYNYREYIECVGGMIMELIDGVHDAAAQARAQKVYFSATDPLSPCDTAVIPNEAKPICYTYLTPHLFSAAGGNPDTLTPEVFEKAFSFCASLPAGSGNRDSCFGGLGKEFIGVLQGRDIRDVGSMDESELATIRAWCGLAHDGNGEKSCDTSALSSLFWGGENNPDAAFSFCALAAGEAQGECYTELSNEIVQYLGGSVQGSALCARLPDPYRGTCGSHSL